MKRLLLLAVAMQLTTALAAQTLNIRTGNVLYQAPAAELTGIYHDMPYAEGLTLTVYGKTFSISDIDSVYIDETPVTDNTVTVAYEDASAQVTVAGNVMRFLDVAVSDAHVTILQADSLQDEITYTLGGTSTDGTFYMNGSLKATLVLNGLNLTTATTDSCAINIRNGKRIAVVLTDGTVNSLTDASGGSQKACFAVKGHTEFKGGGSLTLTGNSSHAFWGKEYVEVKKTAGTIKVASAVGDGIHCNQYYQQNGGTVIISNVGGDGVQVDYKTDDNDAVIPLSEDEDNTAQAYIKGGTLTVNGDGRAAKGIKADGNVVIGGGTVSLTMGGDMEVSDGDASYAAGVKCADYVQNGGAVTVKATGTAARGITANNITTQDGSLDITNSGAGQTSSSSSYYSSSTSYTAKGLKADTSIVLAGGTINITMSGTGGKGIKADGTYTQGTSDGNGPTLTVSTTGSSLSSGSSSGWGGWGGGGPGGGGRPGESSGSSAKAIKVMGVATIYGGESTITTATDGAEGLESKSSINIEGGQHYFKCYDDCINSSGKIIFNGGVTVCWSTGNDAVDSNAGTTGAITIGNGAIFAYTSKGAPEEGFDCDNNSYIQITGKGIGISAGASQGGGGGWGRSSGNTISNAVQGYYFCTSNISYTSGRYYTLADSSGNNLVTYSFPTSLSSSLALFTATGMVKGSSYTLKYSTTAPTDATTAFHGLYLGSSAKGTTSVTSFTAQ